jgi:hypothetical protein
MVLASSYYFAFRAPVSAIRWQDPCGPTSHAIQRNRASFGGKNTVCILSSAVGDGASHLGRTSLKCGNVPSSPLVRNEYVYDLAPFEGTEAAVASSEIQHDLSITRVDDDACTKDYRGRGGKWGYPHTGVFDGFPGDSNAIE